MKLLLVLLVCVFGWKCEGNCNPDPSSTWTAPEGWSICQVNIKAGSTTWTFTGDGCQDGYCVSGIGTGTATANRVCGESPTCKEISHSEFYIAQQQTPTPDPATSTPCPTPSEYIPTSVPATPMLSTPVVAEQKSATETPNLYPTPNAVPKTGGGQNTVYIVPLAAGIAIIVLLALVKKAT